MGNTRYALMGDDSEEITAKLLYVTTAVYEGDWPSLKHSHYFAELFYIRRGSGRFLVENDEVPVREDDMLIINPDAEHTEVSGDDPLEYVVLGVEGLSFTFSGEQQYAVYNFSPHRENLLFYFRSILEETENKEKDYELVCQNLLELLLIHTMRHSQLGFDLTHAPRVSPECSRVKRYLDSSFADDITLECLAERAHLNKYYLVHMFTKYYGTSPMNYLIQKRIQSSKELLESTDHSIADISQLAGFSSQSYFSQSFRKACGMSAGAYRKKAREAKI